MAEVNGLDEEDVLAIVEAIAGRVCEGTQKTVSGRNPIGAFPALLGVALVAYFKEYTRLCSCDGCPTQVALYEKAKGHVQKRAKEHAAVEYERVQAARVMGAVTSKGGTA